MLLESLAGNFELGAALLHPLRCSTTVLRNQALDITNPLALGDDLTLRQHREGQRGFASSPRPTHCQDMYWSLPHSDIVIARDVPCGFRPDSSRTVSDPSRMVRKVQRRSGGKYAVSDMLFSNPLGVRLRIGHTRCARQVASRASASTSVCSKSGCGFQKVPPPGIPMGSTDRGCLPGERVGSFVLRGHSWKGLFRSPQVINPFV